MDRSLALTAEVSEKILPFRVISNEKPIKYNKDGSVSRIRNNRQAGVSTEVFFLSKDEIAAMRQSFAKKIASSTKKRTATAARNLFMFELGIRVGLRISDLCVLRWSDLIDVQIYAHTGEVVFLPSYTLMPKKTARYKKFVTVCINHDIEHVIRNFLSSYPFSCVDDYLFPSQKGGHISEKAVWKILNETAADAHIQKNIGTHSLRKTFGYHVWHNAPNKQEALVLLMELFKHSSITDTLRYIGVMQEEKNVLFDIACQVYRDC